MTEMQSDGGFGTFLESLRDHKTRVPDEDQHEQLARAVEELPEEEVRKRFTSLLEAVNPQAECMCSDLSLVAEGEAARCAYHTSRVGWIVQQARQLSPLEKQQ
jgi:hypothetical protein